MGRPALVRKAIAARTGILAISLIAESSLCNGSLISKVLWINEESAPTMEHMMDMG